MSIKLEWHKFLCKVFGHRWHYTLDKEIDLAGLVLFVCLRCAGTKVISGGPQVLIPNKGFKEGKTNDKNKPI